MRKTLIKILRYLLGLLDKKQLELNEVLEENAKLSENLILAHDTALELHQALSKTNRALEELFIKKGLLEATNSFLIEEITALKDALSEEQ